MERRDALSVTAGQRFGRLLVVDPIRRIGYSQSRPYGDKAALCSCDCGSEKTVRLHHLLSGYVVSCGCRIQNKTHGLHRHPLYGTWMNMIHRCENPRNKDFPNWGARGVRVHPDWHDVTAFISWVEINLGPRPDGCTLDRIDNDGNYEPGNVRWATALQQLANRYRSSDTAPGTVFVPYREFGVRSSSKKVQEKRSRIKHGMVGHPLYRTWTSMIDRCKPDSEKRQWYADRGIRVCDRWHDPAVFIADIERWLGPRSPGMSLDRICNDHDYRLDNVRWATAKQQRANERDGTQGPLNRPGVPQLTKPERIELAWTLRSLGVSGIETSRILGVTTTTVSNYLSQVRQLG